VAMVITVSWDLTLCGLVNLPQCFDGTLYPHFHGRKVSWVWKNWHGYVGLPRDLILVLAGPTYLPFFFFPHLAYSSIQKMETSCSSKTLVKICQTIWGHIPKKQQSLFVISCLYSIYTRYVVTRVKMKNKAPVLNSFSTTPWRCIG
jgi:hypothetical protein